MKLCTYKFTKDMKMLINDKKVILANMINGEWIKISLECYEILKEFVNRKMNEKDILESFEEDDDRIYFKNMIDIMLDKEILVDKYKYTEVNSKVNLKMVTLSVIKRCNLKCVHCAYNAGNEENISELSTKEIKYIIDQIIQCNTESIAITGGEALLRKDIFEIFKYIKANSNMSIILMTNGTLIKKDMVDELVKLVDNIDLSLDGINEETCSKIRGKGVFTKVINAVKLLHSRDFNKISLSMIITAENEKYIKKFERINKELGTKMVLRGFAEEGRAVENRNDLVNFDNNKYALGRENIMERPLAFKCKAAVNEFFIDYNGDIYPCPIMIREEDKMDNIFNIDSFYEFCKSGSAKKCAKIEERKPYNNEKCKDCNVNLFCWSCYQKFESYLRHPDKFEERCKYRKKELKEAIWND